MFEGILLLTVGSGGGSYQTHLSVCLSNDDQSSFFTVGFFVLPCGYSRSTAEDTIGGALSGALEAEKPVPS